MKRTAFLLLVTAICVIAALGQTANNVVDGKVSALTGTKDLRGWLIPAIPRTSGHMIFIDKEVKHGGQQSISMAAISSETSPPYTLLMQYVLADAYIGQRVHFSAFVKGDELAQGGLILRMEGDGMVTTNFDTTDFSGVSDWAEHSIVIDVPPGTRRLVLGLKLEKGQIWADDLKFEVVDRNIPLTGNKLPAEIQAGSQKTVEKYRLEQPDAYKRQLEGFENGLKFLPSAPVNLDFEN